MKHYYLAAWLLLFASCDTSVPGADKGDTTKTEKQIPAEKKKYTGVKETHFPNGNIKSKVSFVDGRMHGKAYNYYKEGGVHSEFEYVDGKQQGITSWYYEDGSLYQEIPYVDGEMEGVLKQYHRNGKLQAEVPYLAGYQGVGMKEYASDGKQKKQYPKLVVKEKDETVFNNKFTLTLSLSESTNWVEYYYGDLTDGKYMHRYMEKIPVKDKKGILEFDVPRGYYLMKKIDLVAKIKTYNNLYYYIHKPYNLSVENR